jgi:hypothetical protein
VYDGAGSLFSGGEKELKSNSSDLFAKGKREKRILAGLVDLH